jgi:dTDP-4-dehydrorhamnose reductase
MKIIILGSNGMLGRYVSTYFKNKKYETIEITRKDIDATKVKEEELRAKLFNIGMRENDVVINCVGLIPQRKTQENLDFLLINSIFPLILANVCEKENVNLIHPTTDCVFNGLNGNYDENSIHDETNIYGVSKSLGEPKNATIIRTSIIGDELYNKLSLVEWVKSNKDKKIFGFTNHIWNGVTCLEFSKICEQIIEKNLFWKGVKHLYSNKVSKFELVNWISEIYDLNIEVESKETDIKCDKSITSLNKTEIVIKDLYEQIKEMKEYSIILNS